jgi:single-strand DNA-binding protein
MLNRAILLGRLTKDPELRYTQSGTAVATFTLAVDRRKKEDGTDFISIVVWSKLAELCAQHLKKGQQAAVDGRIQVRNYEGKNGRVYVTEIVAENVQFLGGGNSQQSNSNTGANPFAGDQTPIDISDDDLPF